MAKKKKSSKRPPANAAAVAVAAPTPEPAPEPVPEPAPTLAPAPLPPSSPPGNPSPPIAEEKELKQAVDEEKQAGEEAEKEPDEEIKQEDEKTRIKCEDSVDARIGDGIKDETDELLPDDTTTAKKQAIRDACCTADIASLQALAVSPGGFVDDGLRQLAWPLLLGMPLTPEGDQVDLSTDKSPDQDWTTLPAHRDEEQVQLDVNRAFVYYPAHLTAEAEAAHKTQLSALVVEVLRRHPFLCYFQGFHDICQVLLLVLAATPAVRAPAVTRLALFRIRDFMLPTIDAAVQQLQLLPDILYAVDPVLCDHLRPAHHPSPFFALSGTLTMYAHDVQTLGAIARLFDVLLARPPAFSLYLFAAVAVAHRDALLATPADEPEMMHHVLSKLPGRLGLGLDGDAASLDRLVTVADDMHTTIPPESLASWRGVPAASVLKTVDVATQAQQTDADGEALFHKHVDELARAERRRHQMARVRHALRQYRGPARAVGVALVIGVVAIALQRANTRGTMSHLSHLHLSGLWHGPLSTATTLLARLGL